VLLSHSALDAIITKETINGKAEILQLHGTLLEAVSLAAAGQHQAAVQVLAPTVLPCDHREALMVCMDRNRWLSGLERLLESSCAAGDWIMTLRCHLRLLKTFLPKAPSSWLQLLAADESATDGGALDVETFSKLATELEKAVTSPDAAAALQAAARFLVNHCRDLSDGLLKSPERLHAAEWDIIQSLMQQLLCVLQACAFARSKSQTGRLSSDHNSSLAAMCDAAAAVVQLWHLEEGGVLEKSAETLTDLLFDLSEALANANQEDANDNATVGGSSALGRRQGLFASGCLHLVCLTMERLQAEHGIEPKGSEFEDTWESLESGLHHSIFWLYGLKLPGLENESWGGAHTANLLAAKTPTVLVGLSEKVCLEVWPWVAERLLDLPEKGLQKYKEFVQTVHALFASPPGGMLELAQEAFAEMAEKDPSGAMEYSQGNPMDGLVAKAHLSQDLDHITGSYDPGRRRDQALRCSLYYLESIVQEPLPVSWSLGSIDFL
jgi:hypothetical protein